MLRKPNQTLRSPSTRLNDTVNQLSDGEFEDAVSLLRGGRKKRKFLELIAWHRGRQPHGTEEEKRAFEGYDLNSLRNVALRQLSGVMEELRSGLPRELSAIIASLGGSGKTLPLDAIHSIGEAKAHALKRCYLERLVKLLTLEAEALPLVYSGEAYVAELERNRVELEQARANLTLAREIAHYRVEYLDKEVAKRSKAGELETGLVEAYLRSDFAKLDPKNFPPLLMSEKCLLDEVFSSLGGRVKEAKEIAESVWGLDQRSAFLSPVNRAKLMVRINDYCIALGDRPRGEQLIAQFATFNPEKPENREIYLVRFLVVLLDWATDGNHYTSFSTALEVYERNEDFVLAAPTGGNRSRILIAMMVIYLGQQEGEKARYLFDHLYRDKDQKPLLYYRICFMICHLMILFDLHEADELRVHSKNYREFMVSKGEFAIPAIDLLGFLQKNAGRFAASRRTQKVDLAYKTELGGMIERLLKYQRQDTVVFRLFYGPYLRWLERKRT
jgi:hypothetical protein